MSRETEIPPRTVLVAEDDLMFREILGEMLAGAGYRVIAASDGQQGWEKIQKDSADLAILDVNMPRLDGLALTRRIRGDKRFASMPILLLTVRSETPAQVCGYDQGADDYLTKPFDQKMLLARLKVLERRILKPVPPSE